MKQYFQGKSELISIKPNDLPNVSSVLKILVIKSWVFLSMLLDLLLLPQKLGIKLFFTEKTLL